MLFHAHKKTTTIHSYFSRIMIVKTAEFLAIINGSSRQLIDLCCRDLKKVTGSSRQSGIISKGFRTVLRPMPLYALPTHYFLDNYKIVQLFESCFRIDLCF